MSYEQLKTDFLIKSPFYSPSINLAIEEFFLKSSRNEFAIFYQNDPAVIIGKHQNIFVARKIIIINIISKKDLEYCFTAN